MKNKTIMLKDKLNKLISGELLSQTLTRPLFQSSPQERDLSLGQAVLIDSQTEAQGIVTKNAEDLAVSPLQLIDRVRSRATTWGFASYLSNFEQEPSLTRLLTAASQLETQITTQIQSLDPTATPPPEWVNLNWIAFTLGYETRAALQRQQAAQQFRDKLLASNQGQPLVDVLRQRALTRRKQSLTNSLSWALNQGLAPNTASTYATLFYDISRRQTEEIWGLPKFSQIVLQGLRGVPINLISVLCTINQYGPAGYTLNPDIFAYQQNPKLEPIPLIVDEMAQVTKLMAFYGISSALTIFIADTDYTEIEANGPVTQENLNNLATYQNSVTGYVSGLSLPISVKPISDLTGGNRVYEETKQKVFEWVTTGTNDTFNRKWGKKWEDDMERRADTVSKKNIFPPTVARAKSLEIARRIWAVNAAQGAAFSQLGPNVLLLSTERRSRDQNYVVDEISTSNFPPVLYILKAAENWNRKIVNQDIFKP